MNYGSGGKRRKIGLELFKLNFHSFLTEFQLYLIFWVLSASTYDTEFIRDMNYKIHISFVRHYSEFIEILPLGESHNRTPALIISACRM